MELNSFVKTMIFIAIGLFFWLFFPFLKSFFVALLLVTAFTPVHLLLENKLKKYPKICPLASLLTASTMTLFLITILFVPILFFIYYIIAHPSELYTIGETFYRQGIRVLSLAPDSISWLKKPLALLSEKVVENQEKIISTAVANLGDGLLGFMGALGNMVMIVIFFFFLSWYRRDLTLAITPIIPIKRSVRLEFVLDMIATTSTGFYTLIGVGIAQGLAFGIFISFFDGYDPLLLGLMIAVTSVIPIVGTALIWIPIALNEFFNGHSANALIIFFYSWAMLSFFIDNIVRLIILQQLNHLMSQGRKEINDFLIFFALIAGLATFGFWGFILGPAIVAFAVTLLRMLRRNHVAK
ncbi:MAG TPA: AI-2E family transporter [Sulfuricurvum sp.]|nr:AI-2E family transporter [Sulfuricurvum sp.]